MATTIATAEFTAEEVGYILQLAHAASEYAIDAYLDAPPCDDDIHPDDGGERFNEAGEAFVFPDAVPDMVLDYCAEGLPEHDLFDWDNPRIADLNWEAYKQWESALELAIADGEYFDEEGNLMCVYLHGILRPETFCMVLESTEDLVLGQQILGELG